MLLSLCDSLGYSFVLPQCVLRQNFFFSFQESFVVVLYWFWRVSTVDAVEGIEWGPIQHSMVNFNVAIRRLFGLIVFFFGIHFGSAVICIIHNLLSIL